MINNRGCDVIRQIAKNIALFHTASPANFLYICAKNITVDDFHPWFLLEFLSKLFHQLPINFDCYYVMGSFGQQPRHSPPPRPDFNNEVIRVQLQGISNTRAVTGIRKKVLSELRTAALNHSCAV